MVDVTISGNAAAGGAQTNLAADRANERAASLAEARREFSQTSAAAADEARARTADALAATREAIARAVGANTRLSISRSEEAYRFVYRAIDVNTGEVVQEWPEEQFVDLIRAARPQTDDAGAGAVLDRIA